VRSDETCLSAAELGSSCMIPDILRPYLSRFQNKRLTLASSRGNSYRNISENNSLSLANTKTRLRPTNLI